ncbi:hypothetical protein PT974_09424 [Cladobotryum mycophilum]|uniref:Uncharacterized protein n=1 Tax=Cladobotryum mycophilum TaxID=491253 RepID=A0ABR0SHI6_9HYPO
MPQHPTVRFALQLTPHFDDSATATHISAKLTIKGLYGKGLPGSYRGHGKWASHSRQKRTIFFHHSGYSYSTPAASFDTTVTGFQARDDEGPLPLTFLHLGKSGAEKECFAEREVHGGIVVTYTVLPIPDNPKDWSRRALRRDQGGLVGVGSSFIPRLKIDEEYDVAIEWNLSQAPADTRAVTSYGEGDVSMKATDKTLADSVFMVGRITSSPSRPRGSHGTYWLGSLPENLIFLKDFNSKMFPHLARFFKDEDGSYRAFIRKVPSGLRGTTYNLSSLIDYDDDTRNEHEWELVKLLNSRTIASWAQIDPEEGTTYNHWNQWFSQGLSSLYSIYLPYRFGLYTPDYFRATLNGFLSAYFTNPFTIMKMNFYQIAAFVPDRWHAESGVAMRACVYMIRMDALTRRASLARNAGVARPLDGIVADICARRRRGEKVQVKDWIKYLADWIGEEAAQKHFDKMISGEMVDLGDVGTAFDGIDPGEQKVMDFGFDRLRYGEKVVQGVEEDSISYKAGLRNGDEVLWHSRPELCETYYKSKFRLLVQRDGKEIKIEYSPRKDEKVRVWQSHKKQK